MRWAAPSNAPPNASSSSFKFDYRSSSEATRVELGTAYALTLLSYGVLASVCLLPTGTDSDRAASYTFAIALTAAQTLWALGNRVHRFHLTQQSLISPLLCVALGCACVFLAPLLIAGILSLSAWATGSTASSISMLELLLDHEFCRAAQPTFSSVPLITFWLCVVLMLSYGITNILIFEGPFVAEKVEHQSRYKAVGLWAYCQGFTRLSCHALGFLVLTFRPLTPEACIWRFTHAGLVVIALISVIFISTWHTEQTDRRSLAPRLSSPFLEPSEDTSREDWRRDEELLYDQLADRMTPTPSGANDTSSLIVSPAGANADPLLTNEEKTAVLRYLKRSRIELIGLCLPFFLFHIINVGFGTFRFLIPSPIKGYEKPRGRFETALIIEVASIFSYLGVTALISFLVPKLALLYTSVAACFVWFGLGLSLYSVAHNDKPTEQIQSFPGASLFYDSAFHFFSSGQRVALLLIALEAMHTRVRVTAFSWAYCASQAGGAMGLLCAYFFYDGATPSSILLTCSLIMMFCIHVLRTMTPTLSIAHATLDDIDLRTARRFASGKSEDDSISREGLARQNSFWSPMYPHSRRPSVKSTRSRNSVTNLSRMERQTIANFI